MTQDDLIERLLQWRLERAEADAPPPPRAEQLLQLAQPWWERWPGRLRSRLERLQRMPLSLGFAQEERKPYDRGYPVATILELGEDQEAFASVLYLQVRDGWLRLRFVLNGPANTTAEVLEATLIADAATCAPIAGRATRAPNDEYHLAVELPASLTDDWEQLRVTDRMPFRLVLRPMHEER